jgi:hypothetical protein
VVCEKLFEVFHPTTREGNDVLPASDTSRVGKLLAAETPDADGDVIAGPADDGREVFRIGSGFTPFPMLAVGLELPVGLTFFVLPGDSSDAVAIGSEVTVGFT